MDLFRRSLEIILSNQSESGAYVAGPSFPVYHYCWFRDATYIAYSLDLVGRHDSAARYHAWAVRTVLDHRRSIERGLRKLQRGEKLEPGEYIHTRYHLDGSVEAEGEWPNFQLDGIGTWLWGLADHLRMTHRALSQEQQWAVELCVDYLIALWRQPCFDCWEERPHTLHTYTLSALYQGLACFASLRPAISSVLSQIRTMIQTQALVSGHLIKDLAGADEVDGNLIGVALPNGVYAPTDPIMRATIARIESDLRQNGGGVHRYTADTYYGGGEWLLLTAWLGWYYAQVGEVGRACQLLEWVEAQADEQGHLPEQMAAHLNQPAYLNEWRQRWGESANPLLWSHAAYLMLWQAVESATH